MSDLVALPLANFDPKGLVKVNGKCNVAEERLAQDEAVGFKHESTMYANLEGANNGQETLAVILIACNIFFRNLHV